MDHQEKSWPSLFSGAMPAASFLCALMNFQKGLVSLFSKALAIVLLIKSALALRRHWVTVFLQCLYLDHMDSLRARLALLNNLFFLRMRRRIGRLIQGIWYLEDVILLGTYWFTIRSSFPLKVFHLVSTSISVNFWKYSVLNMEISARISSHLALENRWILCGIFLLYLGERVQSTTTASWSEYPGIMLTLLTIPGMLVINKSSPENCYNACVKNTIIFHEINPEKKLGNVYATALPSLDTLPREHSTPQVMIKQWAEAVAMLNFSPHCQMMTNPCLHNAVCHLGNLSVACFIVHNSSSLAEMEATCTNEQILYTLSQKDGNHQPK